MNKPEALRLADEWLRKTRGEADRRNSAYDHYGMGNTPENVDPLGAKMVAELRRLHEANEAFGKRQEWWIEKMFTMEQQRDALLEALKEAATSLETVGRLAGKSDYLGDAGERIPTYMGRHDEVREYATSRAGVARAAIKAVEETK